MSTPERFLCAAAARVRGDPLAGTVPVTRRWLLIEHPGPWRHDALGGMDLPAAVLEPVVAALRAQGARALLVRRPGRRTPTADRAWAVLDQSGNGARWGRWSAPRDLLAAAAALAEPGPLPSAEQQVLLVCTHGRHDTCCAIWGRPVAAALAQRWPEATWECSHLGGDRFAASVLLAPDGLYYGHLDPVTAVSVVAAHLRGEVDAAHLRGSVAAAPVVQAALVAAHRALGPLPARGLWPLELTDDGPQRWRVRLGRAVGSGPVEVRVQRAPSEPARLTCGAAGLAAAPVFRAEVAAGFSS